MSQEKKRKDGCLLQQGAGAQIYEREIEMLEKWSDNLHVLILFYKKYRLWLSH